MLAIQRWRIASLLKLFDWFPSGGCALCPVLKVRCKQTQSGLQQSGSEILLAKAGWLPRSSHRRLKLGLVSYQNILALLYYLDSILGSKGRSSRLGRLNERNDVRADTSTTFLA